MAAEIAVECTGATATLEIRNAEQRNALTPGMLAAIGGHLTHLERRSTVRSVVLRGEKGVFSSGYAIDHIRGGDQLPYPDEIDLACKAIERSPLVITAVLQRFAVGAALEVACACDFRIAESGTRLGITPAKFSLVYSATGMARIARVVGMAVTRELFLTARLLDAKEAASAGLVTSVHDSEELDAAVAAHTQRLADLAPLSLAGSKRVLYELAQANPLPHELALELHALRSAAMDSEDAAEAKAAFAEKRPPKFVGR